MFSCCFLVAAVGFSSGGQDADSERVGTVVQSEAFERSGVIRSLRLNAPAADRPLRVGIYRSEGEACNYRLLQQITLRDLSAGANTVRFATIRHLVLISITCSC